MMQNKKTRHSLFKRYKMRERVREETRVFIVYGIWRGSAFSYRILPFPDVNLIALSMTQWLLMSLEGESDRRDIRKPYSQTLCYLQILVSLVWTIDFSLSHLLPTFPSLQTHRLIRNLWHTCEEKKKPVVSVNKRSFHLGAEGGTRESVNKKLHWNEKAKLLVTRKKRRMNCGEEEDIVIIFTRRQERVAVTFDRTPLFTF